MRKSNTQNTRNWSHVLLVSVGQSMHRSGRTGAKRRALASATAVALAALTGQHLLAATQNATWTNGSGNNDWSNAANWSPNGVPNNGSNGFSDYNVSIGASFTVYEDISPTIDTLNNSGTLIINPNQIFTIAGPTVTDNGTIQVDTYSGNAAFNFSGNTTISGSGNIVLDDVRPNARLTTKAGVTLTQSAGHTISGVGEIDAALTNNGTVNANNYGNTLVLQTYNMSNNGLFEATGNGTLSIGTITITQGTGGQIVANGGSVSINGTSIIGGTLNNSSGSPFSLTSANLTNVTVATGSNIVLTQGTNVNVSGTTLTNNGQIQFDTNAGNANLNFTSNITVNGTGTIFLDDNNPFPSINTSNGATVTMSAGQTIDGKGFVNASLVNNGTINANNYGNPLTLQTNAMTNNNVLEATGNGTLNITGITVTQGTNGVIKSDGSPVNITNSNISGGTLNTPNASIGVSNSIFSNVNIATGTTVVVQPSTTLNITGTLTNNGTIQVDTNAGAANLNFVSSVTVAGTGTIFLYDDNPYPTLNTSSGATVTLSSGQTLDGKGIVNASLVNNGIVNANNYGNSLTLQTNTMTNDKVFEATGNGTLNISGITVAQGPNGVIESDGSAVNITNADISGGTFQTPSGSYIGVSNSIFANVNVSTGTTILVQPSTGLSIIGTLTNNGTIQVDNNSGNANLNFASSMTVGGTGTIFLYNHSPSPTINTSNGATVTLSPGQTLDGEGVVNASLINNGVINANFYGNSLTLQTNAMTNNNLFESSGNGTLNINGITVTQAAGAQIVVGNTSVVSITGSNISGGTLNASNGSPMYLTASTLSGVTVSNASSVIVTPSTTVNVIGPLTNNGTIQIDQDSGNANLNFLTNTTVAGTGTIALYDNSPHPTINTSTGATVTFSAGQLVDGEGIINASLVNNGVINANFYGNSLTLTTKPMTNNSLFESSGNGTLIISGITVTQGTAGQIVSGSGAYVDINGSNISGGYLNSSSGSTIYLTSSNLSNVAITSGSTVVLTTGTTVNVLTSLVNNGTIQVDQNASNANLNFLNNTNVSGTGTIFLYDNYHHPSINTSTGAVVTFGPGQLIDGEGVINAALVNNGTIDANFYGNPLTLQTNNMVNNGLIESGGNGTLNINGISINNSGGTLLSGGGGYFNINNSNISGGIVNSVSGSYVSVTNANFTNVNMATGANVTVQGASYLNVIGTSSNGAPNLTVYGTTTFGTNPGTGFLTRNFTSLSLGTGALATVTTASTPSNRTLIVTGALNIAGNNNNWQAKLDLSNNDLDVTAGNLSTITNQIAQGYNGGKWNGSEGIVSTAAAVNTRHLTALGVIQNNQSGTAIYTSSNKFDGTTPGAGDILIKYTYYGDTNLDGKVDGSDYSRIDAAFLADKSNPTAVTGWFNGDFNYDGVIDGSDYTLIDNAFNTQGAVIATAVATSQVAPASAVPEPTALTLLGVMSVGMLSRRRISSRSSAKLFRAMTSSGI
jgi:hypothetical protein